jgi:hypothetical protein
MTTTLHNSDFVKHNAANKTNKLFIWPFWDKNHLTGLKYIPGPKYILGPKYKNTLTFCLKRKKGKQSRKTTVVKYSPLVSQQDKGKQSI